MRIIYFSICAFFNLSILLLTIYARRFTKGSQNQSFLFLVWIIYISTILDIICTYLQTYAGMFPNKEKWLMASTTLYFIFRNLTSVAMCIYIFIVTNFIFKLGKTPWLSFVILAPYAIDFGFLIANIFTKNMFYFDSECHYKRDTIIMVNYSIAFIYLIVGLVVLLKYKKTISRSRRFAIYLMYSMIFISVGIQFFYGNCLVEMFVTSLGVFETMILVQRPDEYNNSNYNVLNLLAFRTHGRNIFINKNPTSLIFIKCLNQKTISNSLDYDDYILFMRTIVNFIKNYMCKNKFSGQIYYIENGRIVIMMQGSMRFKSKEIADYLLENLPTEYKCDDITIDSEFAVCHVCYDAKNNENVLKNFADLMALAECFHEINKDTTKLIEFADERTRSNFEQLANIDRILLDAINNNKFEMYYQPIYSTIENRIVSAEALIRLKHDGKFISPEFFIPASERNGMIHRIGDFVLESVCQFVASDEFKKTGLDYVELNLSVSQCMRSDIADKIQGFVDKYKIDPKQINLEITESAIDRSANTMLQNVSKLSQMGFTFSLDDFGTGYSNIKRVVTLPLKIIKFDKTFVNEASNPQMQIVLKNNIDMMKEMNKEIVVEGIETQDMLKLFSDYKCDFIQGYYFSKPLPVPEFCEWIENWKKTA